MTSVEISNNNYIAKNNNTTESSLEPVKTRNMWICAIISLVLWQHLYKTCSEYHCTIGYNQSNWNYNFEQRYIEQKRTINHLCGI